MIVGGRKVIGLHSHVHGRVRAGVIVWKGESLAVIQRVRRGQTYYVLPDGGVEPGELPQEAAARECLEELGLHVDIGDLVASVYLQGQNAWQYYYHAAVNRRNVWNG